MAVEVVGFEMVQGPVENGIRDKSLSHEKENGKLGQELGATEPIKFGSHGDEPAKVERNDVLDSNVPKDAVEEWPAPKQIHSFYFVKWRPYDDPNIKSKVDHLDKEISKKNQARFQLTEALKAKRSERAELISRIKSLRDDNRQFQSILDEKIKEIEPLQQALGKLRTPNNVGRGGLCSSEEELDDIIYSLQYRIQHESIPLAEEKQLLKEIKQLQGTREKVKANAAMRAKVQDSIGQKETIQDQVKLIGGDLDGVKKERQAIRSKIKQLDDALKAIDQDIQALQEELTAVTQKRETTFESIQQLRKQRDQGNTNFFQSRSVLSKVRELAAKKDVSAIEELQQTEVEKFMSMWNSDKTFRNDYEKRILPSLDIRQLSRDGRMRNPDERPLLEEPKPVETDALPKSSVKKPKEEPKSSTQETLPPPMVQKGAKSKGSDLKSKLDNENLEDKNKNESENPQNETPAEEPAVDHERLRTMIREEQETKRKEAEKRKDNRAKKKAALKQKWEDNNNKNESKLVSGTATVPNPEKSVAADAVKKAIEKEKIEGNVEAPTPVKAKVLKESGVRSRGRAKGPDALPKAILKRKNSNNNWVWVAAASALLVVILLVLLGYNHVF